MPNIYPPGSFDYDFDYEVEQMMKRQRLDYESATLSSCGQEIMKGLMGYLVVADPRDVAYCYEWFNPNTDANVIGTAFLLAPGARYGFDPGTKVVRTEVRDHNGDGENIAPPWKLCNPLGLFKLQFSLVCGAELLKYKKAVLDRQIKLDAAREP